MSFTMTLPQISPTRYWCENPIKSPAEAALPHRVGMDTKTREPTTLLNPRQVSQLLNVSERTLSTWRDQNEGPPYRESKSKSRARIRYQLGALERWLDDEAMP